MQEEDIDVTIANLIAGQAELNMVLRNLAALLLDLNRRVGGLEELAVRLSSKQTANPAGYKPPREAIIHRMEITGDTWEKCEEDIIREHYENLN